MLYYVPLEMYKERYTWQWSAPIWGWLERNWIKAGVEYKRIEGTRRERNYIGRGVVLDAVARSQFCFSQIEQLLVLADKGVLTSDDIIYVDDFWTPGLEALPYLFDQIGVSPRMYSFLFAQSVDEYDFTAKMKNWIRPIEKGYGEVYDGIFVASPFLKELVVDGGIVEKDKVYVTGHPFSSEEVSERMPWKEGPWETTRQDKVVFSSRWDVEKRPEFFLEVVSEVMRKRPSTEFVICTGCKEVRSNSEVLLVMLEEGLKQQPNLQVRVDCSKEEYYNELAIAKIQFNCADQDFVPLTLLEASTAGAYPLYPWFRSFPITFRCDKRFLYNRLDVEDATERICEVLNRNDLWTEEEIRERSWIHERYDESWKRQLRVMGLMEGIVDEP